MPFSTTPSVSLTKTPPFVEPRAASVPADVFRRAAALVPTPVALSTSRLFDAGAEIRSFDVASDGPRFLLNVPAPDYRARPLSVIVNPAGVLRVKH